MKNAIIITGLIALEAAFASPSLRMTDTITTSSTTHTRYPPEITPDPPILEGVPKAGTPVRSAPVATGKRRPVDELHERVCLLPEGCVVAASPDRLVTLSAGEPLPTTTRAGRHHRSSSHHRTWTWEYDLPEPTGEPHRSILPPIDPIWGPHWGPSEGDDDDDDGDDGDDGDDDWIDPPFIPPYVPPFPPGRTPTSPSTPAPTFTDIFTDIFTDLPTSVPVAKRQMVWTSSYHPVPPRVTPPPINHYGDDDDDDDDEDEDDDDKPFNPTFTVGPVPNHSKWCETMGCGFETFTTVWKKDVPVTTAAPDVGYEE